MQPPARVTHASHPVQNAGHWFRRQVLSIVITDFPPPALPLLSTSIAFDPLHYFLYTYNLQQNTETFLCDQYRNISIGN